MHRVTPLMRVGQFVYARFLTRRPFLALSQDRFAFVLNWVDDVFPHDLANYSPTAVCPRLLSTVSVSLLFLRPSNRDDLPQDLDTSHQYVILSNSVLQSLVTIVQSSSSESDGGSSDEEAFPMTKRNKGSQKARKYARRGLQVATPVDSTPFRALHLEVPTSHGEAKEMAMVILSKQKGILKVIVSTATPDSQTNFVFCSHTYASSVSSLSPRY
jgi:hypothetical protein